MRVFSSFCPAGVLLSVLLQQCLIANGLDSTAVGDERQTISNTLKRRLKKSPKKTKSLKKTKSPKNDDDLTIAGVCDAEALLTCEERVSTVADVLTSLDQSSSEDVVLATQEEAFQFIDECLTCLHESESPKASDICGSLDLMKGIFKDDFGIDFFLPMECELYVPQTFISTAGNNYLFPSCNTVSDLIFVPPEAAGPSSRFIDICKPENQLHKSNDQIALLFGIVNAVFDPISMIYDIVDAIWTYLCTNSGDSGAGFDIERMRLLAKLEAIQVAKDQMLSELAYLRDTIDTQLRTNNNKLNVKFAISVADDLMKNARKATALGLQGFQLSTTLMSLAVQLTGVIRVQAQAEGNYACVKSIDDHVGTQASTTIDNKAFFEGKFNESKGYTLRETHTKHIKYWVCFWLTIVNRSAELESYARLQSGEEILQWRYGVNPGVCRSTDSVRHEAVTKTKEKVETYFADQYTSTFNDADVTKFYDHMTTLKNRLLLNYQI